MKKIWSYLDNKTWHAETKFKIMLFIASIVFALLGCALWLVVRFWILSEREWLLCFIGYPIILAWMVVFFYSCRHDFHDGCIEE